MMGHESTLGLPPVPEHFWYSQGLSSAPEHFCFSHSLSVHWGLSLCPWSILLLPVAAVLLWGLSFKFQSTSTTPRDHQSTLQPVIPMPVNFCQGSHSTLGTFIPNPECFYYFPELSFCSGPGHFRTLLLLPGPS